MQNFVGKTKCIAGYMKVANGRVNITSDGNLVLMNSTVQDGGNYKCSYQGFTGPVEESLVNLSVKLLKGKTNLSFVKSVRQVGKNFKQSFIAINQ